MISHTFVVPAYGRSEHLGACLHSLRQQTVASKCVVVTSTPFEGIEAQVAAHGATLVTHSPNRGIGHDWNYALSCVESEWATIAHQDDVYYPEYLEKIAAGIRLAKNPVLAFTDYAELRGEAIDASSSLLRIKRLLLQLGFLGRREVRSRWAKRNCLRFGCAIPCPAVTLKVNRASPLFRTDLKVNLDWAAWLDRADKQGSFVWIREVLMGHRIHTSSETSAGIEAGYRAEEDRMLLESLWPAPVAAVLSRLMRLAYTSNEV